MSTATALTDATAVKSANVGRTKADMVGMGLSGLCMVHCLVFPLLVSVLLAFERGLPGDDVTHRVLCGLGSPWPAVLPFVRATRFTARAGSLPYFFSGLR